jgi:hypothetical protein
MCPEVAWPSRPPALRATSGTLSSANRVAVCGSFCYRVSATAGARWGRGDGVPEAALAVACRPVKGSPAAREAFRNHHLRGRTAILAPRSCALRSPQGTRKRDLVYMGLVYGTTGKSPGAAFLGDKVKWHCNGRPEDCRTTWEHSFPHLETPVCKEIFTQFHPSVLTGLRRTCCRRHYPHKRRNLFCLSLDTRAVRINNRFSIAEGEHPHKSRIREQANLPTHSSTLQRRRQPSPYPREIRPIHSRQIRRANCAIGVYGESAELVISLGRTNRRANKQESQ